VYAHNLGGFDGIFLLKHLLDFGKVEPIIFNSKLISINLKLNSCGKTIIFKDSMLLLPNSLRRLCSSFQIIVPKGYFPYILNDIFYKGVLPLYKYWSGITEAEYLELSKTFKNKTWSFKQEAINYCSAVGSLALG
jgi:DNA polymerase type B, organellar and viral